jgi:hypothetical protein
MRIGAGADVKPTQPLRWGRLASLSEDQQDAEVKRKQRR